jgi:outer membrane receptor protein involved in Fe transport
VGATVVVRATSGTEERTVSGADGRFSVSATGAVELIVQAPGFGQVRQVRGAGAARENIEIVLRPRKSSEDITVTPTRTDQRLGDVAASVNILSREDIRRSPAVVADDVLRQIPTFSLFRRSNSIGSNPTVQGVSLRGIGPSGVSRTLALLDGVPFNDPFGGWVYWTRVPLDAADRIEVVESPGSSLYGNYAMGGVINILTARPIRRTVEFRSQLGSLSTRKVDVRASDVWGRLGVSVDGTFFDTGGYPNVEPGERRTTDQTPPGVDNNVAVTFRTFNVKAHYSVSDRVQVLARAGYFKEQRANGKASTFDQTEEANDTTWKTASVGVRVQLPAQSDLQASLFTDNVLLHLSSLAVPPATPPRSVGRMSLYQTVPTTGIGGSFQWSRVLRRGHVFSTGADWRWIEGESRELSMDTARGQTPVTSRSAGGAQRLAGVFVQGIVMPMPRLALTLGARFDRWRSYDGHFLEATIATASPTPNNKPELVDRVDTALSPRAAAIYRFTGRVSVWGDFGYAFRAPTLNELYRQFAVGAVTTRANDQLGPERLKGGEIGLRVEPIRDLTVRATWYDNHVRNPISNVSLNPSATLLQRQNLGRTRIAGIQTDMEYQVGASWHFAAGYLHNQARVAEFSANEALAGNCPGAAARGLAGEACHLPQVPENRGSASVTYANPKHVTVTVAVQVLAEQFDDDVNTRALPGFTVIDLTASRRVGRNLEVFVGVQNLTDRAYFVGTLPTLLGPPRMASAGVRLSVRGR